VAVATYTWQRWAADFSKTAEGTLAGDGKSLYELGLEAYKQDATDRALAYFNEALRLDTTNADAYLQRGRILAGRRPSSSANLEAAIADFSKAIECNAQLAEAFAERAKAHADQHRTDQALADANQAVRLAGQNPEMLYNRANVKHLLGLDDGALEDCSAALRLRPKMAECFNLLGVIHYQRKQDDLALKELTRAIELDPGSGGYSNRSTVYQRIGEFDKAIADCNVVLRRQPDYVWGHCNRGQAYKGKGQYDLALADYLEALRLDPNYPFAHAAIAWLRATAADVRFRDGARALEHAQKAHELGGGREPEVLEALAAAHAECQQFAKAVEWQDKAIAALPEWDREQAKGRLRLYRGRQPYREAVPSHDKMKTQD
jgi:tetratricopeptide (TPR) repeat protein